MTNQLAPQHNQQVQSEEECLREQHEENHRNQLQELTLIILPHKQLVELGLLDKTDWQYVEAISEVNQEDDIDDSLAQIRRFYGK